MVCLTRWPWRWRSARGSLCGPLSEPRGHVYLTLGVVCQAHGLGDVQISRFSIGGNVPPASVAALDHQPRFEPHEMSTLGPMPDIHVRSREDSRCSHVSHMTQGWGVSPQRAPTGVLTGVRMRVSGAFLHSRTDLRRRPATTTRLTGGQGFSECMSAMCVAYLPMVIGSGSR